MSVSQSKHCHVYSWLFMFTPITTSPQLCPACLCVSFQHYSLTVTLCWCFSNGGSWHTHTPQSQPSFQQIHELSTPTHQANFFFLLPTKYVSPVMNSCHPVPQNISSEETLGCLTLHCFQHKLKFFLALVCLSAYMQTWGKVGLGRKYDNLKGTNLPLPGIYTTVYNRGQPKTGCRVASGNC